MKYYLLCKLCLLIAFPGFVNSQVVNPVGITPGGVSEIWDFDFADSLMGVCYADGQLFATMNSGNSWTSNSAPLDKGSVFVLSMQDIWIGGNGQVAHTTDLGQTWSVSAALSGMDLDPVSWIQFLDQQTGFAQMSNSQTLDSRLFKTTDGGQTWTFLGNNFANGLVIGKLDFSTKAAYFVDADHGFSMHNNNYPDVYLVGTSDGGLTWDSIATGIIQDLDFSGGGIGHWGMDLVTFDNGVNWQPTGDTLGHYAVSWYDSTSALIMNSCYQYTMTTWTGTWGKTTDGGLSRINLQGPNPLPSCYGTLQVKGPGIAYAGGFDAWSGTKYLSRISDILLSTDEVHPQPEMAVYPNPAHDVLNIKVEDISIKQVELFDTFGRKVLQQAFNNNEGRISLVGVAHGIYILRVETTEGISNHRVRVDAN